DQFTHARGRRALAAIDGQEGLGHGHGDLARLEGHDGAVAAQRLVVPVGAGIGGGRLRGGSGTERGRRGVGRMGGGLHVGSWRKRNNRHTIGSASFWIQALIVVVGAGGHKPTRQRGVTYRYKPDSGPDGPRRTGSGGARRGALAGQPGRL